MGCDKVVYTSRVGMPKIAIVRIPCNQHAATAAERDKSSQTCVVKIA